MCGIAGFCNFNNPYNSEKWNDILIKMRESIAHRGPEQTGEYLRDNIGFAHARLSIRDLGKGRQPMIRTLYGKDVGICYNGEIYNADELTYDLKRAGFEFQTTSDTEVILYAYIHYGVDFVKKLNGIFAFAIWDKRCEKLFLYRDRLGVKPLFYTIKNNELVFGSEIKALFCHPNIAPKINDDSFREIFGIGPARTHGNGVFKDIYEIKPAEIGIFDRYGFKTRTYWTLESKEHVDNYSTTVDNINFLVTDAIERQLVSDVPVCSFLSGGLDSSIVTAVSANYLKSKGAKLNTFSFDFTGNDEYFKASSFQPSQDRPYVEQMIDIFDVNHAFLECDETILVDLLERSMISKDLPGMTDVDTSLLHFCTEVKEKNNVALTGECADEIFGGYPWFYREDLLNSNTFPWSKDMNARTVLLRDDIISKLDLDGYSQEKYNNSINEVPKLLGENKTQAKRREISYLNIKWFMQTLLDRMDRASMNTALEARVPFADHRILEYMFNVPWEMKYQKDIEKYILRIAFRNLLPDELLFRKKSPYPKTYNPRFEILLKEKFQTIIQDKNSPILDFLDIQKCNDFCNKPLELSKPWFGQLMAGPQMLAYMIQVNSWLNHFGY